VAARRLTILRQMEDVGHVTRQKVPGNQREVRVFLTSKGVALRGESVAAAEEVNRLALEGLSREDRAAARVLIAVVENLQHRAS
jgi:MarR family transcriptional regulator, organic hydroperoxide resistance regulator